MKVLAPNIKILDDHFSKPYGKGDQLKAPAHFPDALQMFTVQELTVIWHMFGGDDFGLPQKKADESPKGSSKPFLPSINSSVPFWKKSVFIKSSQLMFRQCNIDCESHAFWE